MENLKGFLTIASCLLLSLPCPIQTKQTMSMHKTQVVDVHQSSTHDFPRYLVRSNCPGDVDGNFNYTFVTDMLRQKLGIPPRYGPSSRSFFLYSTAFERRFLREEEEYFQQHPEDGLFRHWPQVGDLISPWDVLSQKGVDGLAKKAKKIDDWLGGPDRLLKRTDELHHHLTHGFDTDRQHVVLLFHCVLGVDRTGQMAGAYNQRFVDKSLYDSLLLNQHTTTRKLHPLNSLPDLWVCLHSAFHEADRASDADYHVCLDQYEQFATDHPMYDE